MVFSERDVDVLRFLCWCQYVKREDLRSVATEAELAVLSVFGLIKLHESSGALVITAQGRQVLDAILCGKLPSIKQPYHQAAIERRLRLSRLTLTAYRAGVNVFTTRSEELAESPAMFPSSITRDRGYNPWGSTRIAALLRLPDLVAAMHYVAPGIGNVAFVDEINVLVNQSARIKGAAKAFIFAGESYADVLAELGDHTASADAKKVRYGDAYRASAFPIHLLPCNDTGAKQLRIMSVPDYRRWFSKATLQAEYSPPPPGVPEWDAMFRGAPFVMAADMDLRRIDRAVAQAKRRGFPTVSMAALESQAADVLYPRYVDAGKAKVFVWTPEMEEELFGRRLALHTPRAAPYRNVKGEYINAPLIQAARKSGRPARKEARKLV